MKKLSLILGALLAVGTVAQAKEQMIVAPPVVEEVEIVEPVAPVVEEIVVQDTFRPSGYVGLEYKAYGNTEGHGDKIKPIPLPQDEWHRGANKYSRLQTTFGVQATENFRLEGRVRDYSDLEKNDNSRVNKKTGTETRLREFYKHSDLLTSRVEYKDYTSNDELYAYQLRVTPYRNEGGIVDMFTIAPKYAYKKYKNGTDYRNTVGADIYLTGNLPLGFTWENNIYLDYNMYNKDVLVKGIDNSGRLQKKDKEFVATWEFYLYNTIALYTADSYKVDFNFEGGYDPYVLTQYKGQNLVEGTLRKDKESYSLYTSMDISLTYNVTDYLTIKTGAGAEYRNWDIETRSRAKNWRWQPFAYAAMNVKF